MTYEPAPVDAMIARQKILRMFTAFEFVAYAQARALPLEEQLALSVRTIALRKFLEERVPAPVPQTAKVLPMRRAHSSGRMGPGRDFYSCVQAAPPPEEK